MTEQEYHDYAPYLESQSFLKHNANIIAKHGIDWAIKMDAIAREQVGIKARELQTNLSYMK